MGKETFYFSHDYNTRSDTKIKKLIAKYGYEGYGLYWAIVEDLYQNANAMRTDYDCIAFDMRSTVEIIKSIVEDFELFQIKDNYFGSLSIQRRIDERDAKSRKARDSAFYRWNKNKIDDANAMRTQCDSNAIKESKVKESKVKEYKEDNNIDKSENPILLKTKSLLERKLVFKENVAQFKEKTDRDTLNAFFKYWTEPNKNKSKMRFEGEKYFDVSRRLQTWIKNNDKFNKFRNE